MNQLVGAQQIKRRIGIGLVQAQHTPTDGQSVQVGDHDLIIAPRPGTEVQRDLAVGHQIQSRCGNGPDAIIPRRDRPAATDRDTAQRRGTGQSSNSDISFNPTDPVYTNYANPTTGDDVSFYAYQNITAQAVPEPITMSLVGMGIFGLGGYIRRRAKAAK